MRSNSSESGTSTACNITKHISDRHCQRKCWKLPLSTTPLSFDAPSQGTSANIRINLTSPEARGHWPTFLLLIVWVYLHSNFCDGLQKTHLFCNRVNIGRSRSSKVVDFGTNRNGVCNFLLVINSNCGPTLHHFWDTATYWLKIVNFSYPTLIKRPRSGRTHSNFWMHFSSQKLESLGHTSVKISS